VVCYSELLQSFKLGFHYPSWRVTGFHYPSTREMETSRPSTRVVETGLYSMRVTYRRVHCWDDGLVYITNSDKAFIEFKLTLYCSCLNPTLISWPWNPKTMSFLGYPKVIRCTKFENTLGSFRFRVLLWTNRQTWTFSHAYRLGPISFLAGCCKRRLDQG